MVTFHNYGLKIQGVYTLHGLKSSNYSTVPVNVKGCDDFWEGHIGCDGSWDTDLVDLQVGIWGDDSSGGEVHTLAHEVTSNSPLFAL